MVITQMLLMSLLMPLGDRHVLKLLVSLNNLMPVILRFGLEADYRGNIQAVRNVMVIGVVVIVLTACIGDYVYNNAANGAFK